mmetsp:Transcript_30593/g.30052  ORF Transcript_30593/g.30052 Transcript_30593/m.30052 type:complete len:101 (+) Transcript_30593:1632-1934(+)
MMQQQMMQQQMMMQQQQARNMNPFLQKTIPLLPAVVPQNPNLKQMVGENIFEFVEKVAGDDYAPKITGMLIDLPLEEVRAYMQSFERFEEKVREAHILLQ